jgi:hypothetical protein
LPTPLPGGTQTQIETEFVAAPGLAAEPRFLRDRVEVSLAAPDAGEVEIGVRSRFTAASPAQVGPAVLDPAEAELYLRHSEGLIRVDEGVRALARRLAGGETDPWSIMRRYWAFMMDDLAFGPVHYDRIDAADPYRGLLDEGWYDCRLGASLLAALCRARGVPARIVNGYVLYPAAPDIHTWLEVWIDGAGWRPFDLCCWELSARTAGRTWRDHFFGRIGARMAVERPPRLFAGTGDVRLPAAWHILSYADETGTVVDFLDLETGALVYSESIAVVRL